MSNLNAANTAIHVASTLREIHEIQRFRYQVYVQEMELPLPGIDHARKVVVDPLDSSATHFYCRIHSHLAGAVRLNLNAVPHGLEEPLQTPGLPQPFVYCSRLYVLAKWRGKGVVADLAQACFAYFFRHNASIAICHCYPHLIKLYAKLGFRPYAAPFVVPGLEHLGSQSPLSCLLTRLKLNLAA